MENPDKLKCFLAALGEVYGKEVTTTMAQLYWGALSDYTDEQVDAAIKAGVKKWKCYGRIPTPGEIIDEITGDDDQAAFVAWESLLYAIQTVGRNNSVRFEDGKITRVVLALGGWMEVCNWLNSEMHYRRNEFFKLYKATPASNDAKYLPGLIETNNMSRGFIEHIPNPITIGNRHTDMAVCVAIMPHNGKTDTKMMLDMGGQ